MEDEDVMRVFDFDAAQKKKTEKTYTLTQSQLVKLLHIATGNVRDFVMDNDGFIKEHVKTLSVLFLLFFSTVSYSQNHFKPYKPTAFVKKEKLGSRYSDGNLMVEAYYVTYKNQVYNQLELKYLHPDVSYVLIQDRCSKSKAINMLKRNHYKIVK